MKVNFTLAAAPLNMVGKVILIHTDYSHSLSGRCIRVNTNFFIPPLGFQEFNGHKIKSFCSLFT